MGIRPNFFGSAHTPLCHRILPHYVRTQYFGDIAVLLDKLEPATIRVSSLKVLHGMGSKGEGGVVVIDGLLV